MSAPPPLRHTGLLLHADGHFTHEGQPIRHPRLRALLERSVRHLSPEDVFVVQVGRFRGQIDVEDAPFFVRAYDPGSGAIELSDTSVEPLRVDTLEEDAGGILYCEVKDGFTARFTHAAQAHLLAAIELRDGNAFLSIGGTRTPVDPRPRSAGRRTRAMMREMEERA
jgi:hypothetical protein